jgi:hypothetical protein
MYSALETDLQLMIDNSGECLVNIYAHSAPGHEGKSEGGVARTVLLVHGHQWSSLTTQRPLTLSWCARRGLKQRHLSHHLPPDKGEEDQ